MLARQSRRSREVIELFAQKDCKLGFVPLKFCPAEPDYLQLIKSLAVSTLLVIGDSGSVVSPEMAAESVQLNQHLWVKQIEEAGHRVLFDQPEHFATVVQTFLHAMSNEKKA